MAGTGVWRSFWSSPLPMLSYPLSWLPQSLGAFPLLTARCRGPRLSWLGACLLAALSSSRKGDTLEGARAGRGGSCLRDVLLPVLAVRGKWNCVHPIQRTSLFRPGASPAACGNVVIFWLAAHAIREHRAPGCVEWWIDRGSDRRGQRAAAAEDPNRSSFRHLGTGTSSESTSRRRWSSAHPSSGTWPLWGTSFWSRRCGSVVRAGRGWRRAPWRSCGFLAVGTICCGDGNARSSSSCCRWRSRGYWRDRTFGDNGRLTCDRRSGRRRFHDCVAAAPGTRIGNVCGRVSTVSATGVFPATESDQRYRSCA